MACLLRRSNPAYENRRRQRRHPCHGGCPQSCCFVISCHDPAFRAPDPSPPRLRLPTMDLRGIRYFVQIAELGSITRAAQQLRVAQPALSRQLHGLEQELGVTLLVRLPRGVRLTTAGRQFLDHCQRILRELSRAQEELRGGAGAEQSRVILGVSPTTGPLLLPGVVERMRRQCPQISLKVVDGFSYQLYEWLQAGRADVAVLTNPVNSRTIRVAPLISEPVVVFARAQPRPPRRYFTVAELARTPVVSTEAIRTIADEQLQRFGARVRLA
ncbi:MAG: LysR family transcriptional regulator, partial [Betaproteobacteria bacterium]|nr:LysR family transcriptional regulator [Betaproteobacteria bacterium]